MTDLTEMDFIIDGENRLVLTRPGVWVVMFRLPVCKACIAAKYSVLEVVQEYSDRINYGRVDVAENKRVVSSSANSSTPIKKVPMFITYHHGLPVMMHQGPYTKSKLTTLIDNTLEISERSCIIMDD